MDFGWVSACPPGEFEAHAALLLSFTELLLCAPHAVVELVRGLTGRISLLAIVSSEEQRQHAIVMLTDWGVPAHRIHFMYMPVGTWTRDFGPVFVRWCDGNIVALDAEYSMQDRGNENIVPTALAYLLKVPRRQVPLVVDGGNLLGNGRGVCLFTSALLEINRFCGREYTLPMVESILAENYGFTQPVVLEPLLGYRTLHVDMMATFVRADTIVVGACDPAADPASAAVLNRNADRLSRVVTRGRPLRVIRIPMPTYDGTACRTYTNVIYANGKLLVPHYPEVDRGIEREVLATYGHLLPGWEISQVDCSEMIRRGGGLRCLSTHIPWLHERFWELDEIPGKPEMVGA